MNNTSRRRLLAIAAVSLVAVAAAALWRITSTTTAQPSVANGWIATPRAGASTIAPSLAPDPFLPVSTWAHLLGWRNVGKSWQPDERIVRSTARPFRLRACIADARALGEAELRSARDVFGPNGDGIADEYVLRYGDATGAAHAFMDIRTRFSRCFSPRRQAGPQVGHAVTAVIDVNGLMDPLGPVDEAFLVSPPPSLLWTAYKTGVVRDGNVVIMIETVDAWPDGGVRILDLAPLWATPGENQRCRWVGEFPGAVICRPEPSARATSA
jgi:hypothetical protein